MSNICDGCNEKTRKTKLNYIEKEKFCNGCFIKYDVWKDAEIRYVQLKESKRKNQYFMEDLMKSSEVSDEAFRLAYFVVHSLTWNKITTMGICKLFNWKLEQALQAIDTLAEVKLITINES